MSTITTTRTAPEIVQDLGVIYASRAVTRPYRSQRILTLAELNDAKQALVATLDTLGKAKGFGLDDELLSATEILTNIIISLHNKVNNCQEWNSIAGYNLKNMNDKDVVKPIEHIRRNQMRDEERQEDLYTRYMLLEGRTLKYPAFKGTLELHEYLEKARYCVAAGFCHVFGLPTKDILGKYYDVALDDETVFWASFRRSLQSLFLSYHVVECEGNGRHTLHQTYSCFKGMPINEKIGISPGTSNFGGLLHPRADDGLPRSIVVGDCDKAGLLLSETAEGNVRHQLCFFRPAFIWKYNEAKKIIADLDTKIYKGEDSLYRFGEDLRALKDAGDGSESNAFPPGVPPDSTSRFLKGTAVDFRKSSHWRALMSQPDVTMDDSTSDNFANTRFPTKRSPAEHLPTHNPTASIRGGMNISPPSGRERRAEIHINMDSIPKEAKISILQKHNKSLESRLDALRSERKRCLTDLNNLRACLEILLKEEVLEMAISKDVIFKKLIGAYKQSFADKQDESSISKAAESLDSIRNLWKEEGRAVPQKDSRTIIDGLLDAIRTNDEYYDKNETIVETIIDNHIGQIVARQSQDGNTETKEQELAVLLSMFDSLYPPTPAVDTENY